jgi:hypothetical protein
MSYYVRKTGSLALWNLKSQRDALINSVYPRISVLGLVGIPAGLVLLLCATVVWLLVFILGPMLLTFVWMVLQPYRLWLFLKSRITGRNFLS